MQRTRIETCNVLRHERVFPVNAESNSFPLKVWEHGNDYTRSEYKVRVAAEVSGKDAGAGRLEQIRPAPRSFAGNAVT